MGTEREQNKKILTEQTGFLQGCVPTATSCRNWECLNWHARIKHVKPKGEQCCRYNISICSKTTTNHRVSFGCKASGFNHSKCSSGGPKSSIVWFLLNISSLEQFVWRHSIYCSIEHYQLGHRNLFWKITETTGLLYINKNVKRNKLFGWQEMDKNLFLTDGATVHFLLCRQAPLLWHKQLTVRGT